MYSIEELKAQGTKLGTAYEILWETLEKPEVRTNFENTMNKKIDLIPAMERQFQSLIDGEDLVHPETGEIAPPVIREAFVFMYEAELISLYALVEIRERYNLVNNITMMESK